MKTNTAIVTGILAVLLFAGCQSPVSNPQTAQGGSTSYPLGKGSGVTVYAATDDGNGVLVYFSSTTNWTGLDWTLLYPNGYGSQGLAYPPVRDVTIDPSSGLVYAATDDGLIVGSGSSWQKYASGQKILGVSVSGGNVFASTVSGLKWASTSSLPAIWSNWTASAVGGSVSQWMAFGTGALAAGASGWYYSSSPTGTYTSVTPGILNAGSVNVLYDWTAGNVLYVGTNQGISTTTSTGSPTAMTVGPSFDAAVTGLARNGATLVAGTTVGLAISTDSGSTWSPTALGAGARSVAAGANSSTFYVADGTGGLGLLTFDSSGSPSWNAVLSGECSVSKVFVTTP